MRQNKGNILLIILAVVGILSASVVGYFWWQKNQVSREKSVGQESSSGKTADWKTYTSSSLGIAFKYPNNWYEIRRQPEEINLVTTKPNLAANLEGLSVKRYKNPAKLGSKDWWRNFRGENAKYLEKNFTTDLTVDSSPAVRENPDSAPEDFEITYVYVSHNNWVYEITDTTKQENFSKKMVFDQILSTFKFLDQNQTQSPSGIFGAATLGPTCPGPQREGQVCEKAYVGTVVIMKSGPIADPTSLEEFTRFQTDQNGNFRVNLPPGDYIALPFPKNAITFSKTQIHVDLGKFTNVDIVFDTGIR